MLGTVRIFRKDFLELALNNKVLVFLLTTPLVLLFLVGQIRVHDLPITVAVVASSDQSSNYAGLMGVLSHFANLHVRGVSVRPSNILSWMETEQVDLAIIWEGRWHLYTLETDVSRLQRIETLAKEIHYSLKQTDLDIPPALMKSLASTDLFMFYPPASVRDLTGVPRVIALMSVFLPFLLASGAYIREREAGTFEALLLVSGGKWGWFFVGKAITPVLVGFIEFLLMLVLARTWFGFGIKFGMLVIFFLLLLGVITTACLGFAVSTFVRSQQQAYAVAAIYLIASVLLTGFIYPLDQASGLVRAVSWCFPLTLVLRPIEVWISRGTSSEPFTLNFIWLGCQCFAAMALGFLSLVRARKNV